MTPKQSDAKKQRLKNLIEAADAALEVMAANDGTLAGEYPSALTIRLAAALEGCRSVFTCHTCEREDVGPASYTEHVRNWRTRRVERRDYCSTCAEAAEERADRELEYKMEAERDLAREDDVDNERWSRGED